MVEEKLHRRSRWSLIAVDRQTVQINCNELTFTYLGFQDSESSPPVWMDGKPVDASRCPKPDFKKQFPALYSPKQKCQQIEMFKWRCEGDFLPMLYERQQQLQN